MSAYIFANFKLKNVCITNGEMDAPRIAYHVVVYTCFIIMKIKKMMWFKKVDDSNDDDLNFKNFENPALSVYGRVRAGIDERKRNLEFLEGSGFGVRWS